ncbi:MAG: alpha-glucan family phosphorylase [Burkholderiales bacterium]|nr:alpha-glucan family phosphorylase [Burkholderiales bacterium]
MKPGTTYTLRVSPSLPPRLARLEELANDLHYSWDRATRNLFARLDASLWNALGRSPKMLLRCVDEKILLQAAQDPRYLESYDAVLAAYDAYHAEMPGSGAGALAPGELVAYFCAEFGFHESLPLYSGGLGILAGDHCKTASDLHLGFVAVGLMYRQGYFQQTLDSEGRQQAEYADSDYELLPVTPVTLADGRDLTVQVELPGRAVSVKVWRARVGRVSLYLLDTDVESNGAADREIGHRLYGGDRTVRMEQEIVLGVGGTRALAALSIRPTVWHINEGHAAFLVLERIRRWMRSGLDFATALETVASNTVFTTHTPVPAGHDHFATDMVARYFAEYCRGLGLEMGALLELGCSHPGSEFNMTVLALRGSRIHNGVSRIHRNVSAQMLAHVWPGIAPEENPIGYVRNAVHVPTFLAPEWTPVFDRYLGIDWAKYLSESDLRERIHAIPDREFWAVQQNLKARLLHMVCDIVTRRQLRTDGSEAHLDRLLRFANPDHPDVLTLGFARRFATYKRATLLFEDMNRVRALLSDPERPVLVLFSGKAHPADGAGCELIRRIDEISRMPEFEGRILMLEGYELHIGRRMVSGVDVWLNNPMYPLEASGTSGMKAGMNGNINLSVLDGWWDEGFEGDNGWAIRPTPLGFEERRRNAEESRALYEILEDRVLPLYYQRGLGAYSPEWVHMAKRSMASILSRYGSNRMLQEYASQCYEPAARQGRRYRAEGNAAARAVAAWKARVRAAWPGVQARRLDDAARQIAFGGSLTVEVGVQLNGLDPADIAVELMLSASAAGKVRTEPQRHLFTGQGATGRAGEQRYSLRLAPDLCGQLDYRIRVYPRHDLLTHPFELGLMSWL